MSKRQDGKRLGFKEFLLALFLMIVVWAARDLFGIDSATRERIVEPEPTGTVRVMFTSSDSSGAAPPRHDGLHTDLADAINQAQRSVDVAAFDFDLAQVAEALVRAQQRGAAVRLVTDSDYEMELGPTRLRDAQIPVVTDGSPAFMHNKFVVIDESQVWTGSWNLTENGTYVNDNNVIIVDSTKLAENYTAEFEEMFAAGAFGASSPDLVPHPLINLNDTLIETHFEAEGNVRDRMVDLINRAEDSIHFMAFLFTDDKIARALIARHQDGLVVSGVIEARNIAASGSDFERFRKAGLDVLEDGNPHIMHHKVIVIDEALVITGSYNFTANAADNNDENILIFHSPEIAARYLEEFERVYQEALTAKESG
jgi:phosphatidylserine/phosphatidylglycerophosphate/cardiolipin synthase-like enzyme